MTQRLSDAELEIMQVIWSAGGPMLFASLTEALTARGRPWQKNTLITLLNRLLNKGFLQAKKTGRRNEYTALITESAYQAAQTRQFLDKLYAGSASSLVTALIAEDQLTDEEYQALRQLLEKEP